MKKTLIALAVAGAAVATGANANELYNQDGTTLEMGGRAEARLSFKDAKADDASRVRLNFLGKTAINDNLYGVGFYEAEYKTNDRATNADGESVDGNSIEHRYLYAGVGGKFGEVTYGKTSGALGVITDFTDIMAYHGNSAAEKLGVADRVDDMIAYQGQFDNLGVKASYRLADRTEDAVNDEYSDNGDSGFSLSAIYAFGDSGFKLGGGYADEASDNEFMVAASYAFSDFYVAGTFTSGEMYSEDYTGFEVAASYTLGKAVFSTTYNNAELDNDDTNSRELKADNFAIDATYYFKPNFRTYISYNLNLLDAEDAGSNRAAEDEAVLGMRYDF